MPPLRRPFLNRVQVNSRKLDGVFKRHRRTAENRIMAQRGRSERDAFNFIFCFIKMLFYTYLGLFICSLIIDCLGDALDQKVST
ncbi:hypothetical protein HNY73_007047 [Argiope bruennichi]|uniref:Uncharacterized protein n=1 Tax=Argiope bruennichi TaxID=94029 RepID=A0A8T0FFE7_ARGBR|nr:hypothetical protein HNY73_007047 [Argiope bruennichi]